MRAYGLGFLGLGNVVWCGVVWSSWCVLRLLSRARDVIHRPSVAFSPPGATVPLARRSVGRRFWRPRWDVFLCTVTSLIGSWRPVLDPSTKPPEPHFLVYPFLTLRIRLKYASVAIRPQPHPTYRSTVLPPTTWHLIEVAWINAREHLRSRTLRYPHKSIT